MMSNAHGREAYAHMNNGKFGTLYIGRPEGRTKHEERAQTVGTTDEQR